MMPRINSFPRHVWSYVAQLMKLLVYEKGREIVRDGHRAIGYYIILSGGCDVISVNNEGLLKIEEFEAGDTFGDNSFSVNTGKTPHTVITNQITELLVVEPVEIEIYLDKLRLIEKEAMQHFCASWWPFTYWNWKEEHFKDFANKAEFLRFNNGEIVHDNSLQQIEKLFFILKGRIQFIRLVAETNSNNANSLIQNKFISICFFENNNFFGMGRNLPKPSEWFVANGDEINVIRISKDSFLSIHRHSCFLLSQLNENYNLALPTSIQCSLMWEKKIKRDFYARKYIKKCVKIEPK